jgi:O-antigen/teichoic acid export membrane protein
MDIEPGRQTTSAERSCDQRWNVGCNCELASLGAAIICLRNERQGFHKNNFSMLKDSIKFLARDTFVYGISGSVATFLAIFTVPIIARILSKAEYGTIDAVLSATAVFGSFVILGQDSAIARFFYDEDKDQAYRRRVASTGLAIQVVLIITLAILYVFFADRIGAFIFADNNNVIYYWKIQILMIPGSALFLFSTNIFKWTFQRGKYLLLSLGGSVLTVVLTLYFVVYLRWGILGVILPSIISRYLFSTFGLVLNRNYINFKYLCHDNLSLVKEMISYGLPFMAVMLLGALMPSIDRWILIRYTDLSQIGVYAVSTKIASLMRLVVGAFQIAFGPYAFSIWKKEGAAETFAKLFVLYFLGLSFLAVLICGFGDIILVVFASGKYAQSVVTLPPLVMAYIFEGLLAFTLLGIMWAKKTVFNIFVFGISTVVLFLSNYLLVPHFTIIGAAFSLLVARACMNIVAYVISNRSYKINIQLKPLFTILCIAMMTFVLTYLDYYTGNTMIYSLKILSVLGFPIFCFFAVFNSAERQQIMLQLQVVWGKISSIFF